MYSVSCEVRDHSRTGLGRAVPGQRRRRVRGALRPPLVELHLVHRPHRALHVLHAHEAFVQRQVVTDCILCAHAGLYLYARRLTMRYCFVFITEWFSSTTVKGTYLAAKHMTAEYEYRSNDCSWVI